MPQSNSGLSSTQTLASVNQKHNNIYSGMMSNSNSINTTAAAFIGKVDQKSRNSGKNTIGSS